MSSDDPFGVFGEDSDSGDDEQSVNNVVVRTMAKSMIAQTNEKLSKPPVNQQTSDEHIANKSSASVLIKADNHLVLPWPKPNHLNPSVVLVSSLDEYGGGRGYVAQNFIPAGSLIMIEESLVSWPTDNMEIGVDMLLFLMQQQDIHPVLGAIEHLYPTKNLIDSLYNEGKALEAKFDESPVLKTQVKEMMMEYDQSYHQTDKGDDDDDVLDQLIQFCAQSNIRNPGDKSELSRTDILRILVALRYNSLETGIYLHIAMLNHEDIPNCVKFKAEGASEVRATRDIQAGEALTISYLPRLLSHATRRLQLWQHHRFDIGGIIPASKGVFYEMELLGKRFPQSSLEETNDNEKEESIQARVEAATSELEEELQEILAKQRRQQGTGVAAVPLPDEEKERCKALEVASEALCRMATDQLDNHMHVLLLNCCQLHIDSCDVVLQQQDSLGLSFKQHNALLGRLIVSSMHLWRLQESLYGPHYYQLASTFHEIHQAIEQVLSRDAGFLQDSSFLDSVPVEVVAWANRHQGPSPRLGTVAGWSSLEHYTKTRYLRIKALYPDNKD